MTNGAKFGFVFIGFVISLSNSCRIDYNSCTEPLKGITENKDFLLALEKSELDEMCSTLSESLKCLDDYIHSCLPREQKNVVNNIIGDSMKVIQDLCEEGEFQESYLRHAHCFQISHLQNGECFEKYEHLINVSVLMNTEASQRLGLRSYCCSYSAYLHCAVVAAREVCGEETADFMEQYLHRSVDSLVRGQCNMESYSEEECSAARGEHVLDGRTLLFAILFSFLRLCVDLLQKHFVIL